MEAKEQNVEYHIEIQKCDEGVENENGEVMYVLDFGGADIPENLAMSIAQWAADRSLSLGDGANSFVVQNDMGLEETQIMQIETDNTAEGEEAPQVIHVKMEDGSDYIMDTTSVVGADNSVVYNLQDEVIHIEKPGSGGRVELLKVDGSVIDYGQTKIQIQNPDGTESLVSRKPFVVKNVHENRVERKSTKSQTGQGMGSKHSDKNDRLPITPFLKGKTPVMLVVGEDGNLTADVSKVPSPVIKDGQNQIFIDSKSSPAKTDENHPSGNEPMILDFSTEKSKLTKLDNSLATAAKVEKKENVSITANRITRSLLKPKEPVELPESVSPAEKISSDSDSNAKAETVNVTFKIEREEEGQEEDNMETQQGGDDEEEEEEEEDSQNNMEVEELREEPEENFKCCMYENCQFISSDPDTFAAHLEDEHKDFRPHCCFECEKRFKLNLTLKVHQLVHMKDARPAKKKRGPYGARDKFYVCPLCSEKKKLKRELQLHAKEEHNIEKTYTCESCKFICYTSMELDEHNESVSHRTDNRNYCEICNQLFTNIYQHRAAVHTTNRPFLCNDCGYSAKTKSSLRYHMVTHLTTKDWACPSCPYKSTTERRLKRHMKIHDPNKKHVCNLCSFATHDAYEYKRHFIKVHSKSKSYNCKFCEQKFDKHHEIRLHLMFEHDCNDAFFCNFCDFTCATRAAYKEHIQVHYGKNKHVCEICGFTGRYRTHYRRHMLTHSDDKPFACPICGKKVSEASNLRRHMLTHSEDKPLACSVCGYRCKIRSRLMNHMKTHSELRPFSCHLCKYTTKFNGNLMKHLENHAKYKPHKCQYCSYSCNERNKLRRHMNFRHKGMLEPKQEIEDGNVMETNGSSLNGKMIAMSSTKDQILLLPKEELVIMQGDEERVVLPVDENGMITASDQQDLVAQLENGSVILTVEEASSETQGTVAGLQDSIVMINGNNSESMVVLTTGGESGELSVLEEKG